MSVPPRGQRDHRAVVLHVELVGQQPAVLTIDRRARDFKGRVGGVVVGPYRTDRQRRTQQNVVVGQHGPKALIHAVLPFPRTRDVVRSQPRGNIGGQTPVVGQLLALPLLGGPQGGAAEVHGGVPAHGGLIDPAAPAQLDFLDRAARCAQGLQRCERVLAHLVLDRHVAQIHGPGHAQLGGRTSLGQFDAVGQAVVVEWVRAGDDVLAQRDVADVAREKTTVVVAVEVGRWPVGIATVGRLVPRQPAAACWNAD